MFEEHAYGELLKGLTCLKTGELIAGFGSTGETVTPKTHRHRLICLHAADTEVASDFVGEVERALPYSYQHARFYTAQVPKTRLALDELVPNRNTQTQELVLNFEAAVDAAFPGYIDRESHDHLRDLLGRLGDSPMLVFFSLPSPAFCKTILALGGQMLTVSRCIRQEAEKFVRSLSINVGWQEGEPPTHGDYEAQWDSPYSSAGPKSEVMYLGPKEGESTGTWFVSSSRIPTLPPQRWRPLPTPT